jgi:hypothetical protein
MKAQPAALPAETGLTGFLQSVNRFFFQPSDTATLGLIRICAGFLTLYVHLIYSYDLYNLVGKDAWISHDLATDMRKEYPISPMWPGWTEPEAPPQPRNEAEQKYVEQYKAKWGTDPRAAHDMGYYVWSAWFHVTDPTWIAVVHAGILVCMLLFALGLWTPVTGVVTWLGTMSYVNRATTTFFGMDTIMIVLVTYLMLAHLFARPSTLAFSLDRLLWRRRMAKRGARGAELGAPTTSSMATFAIRLMQIHFCVIYMGSGWSKLMGSAWWNGTAIWYTMANPEFAPMHMKYYRDALTWLAAHRALWEVSMTGGSVFTLLLEVGFPFLVWVKRLRWVMVIGSVMLHTGIALFMGLTGFSLMMLALLVAFIPPETVRRLLGLAERAPGLVRSPVAAPTAAAALRS